MKKRFIFIANLILVSTVFISCSNFNVFKDITFGSDMESVENILKQGRIKYKTYPAAPMMDIDVENPEEILHIMSYITNLGTAKHSIVLSSPKVKE